MKRRSAGFVLVAVLWVLAALAVLAAYIDGVATDLVEDARLAKRSLERELDRRSTQATVIYLLATGRMNRRGLILETPQRFADTLAEDDSLPDEGDGELFVTGRVYAGLGDTRFAVQDESGLVSVNSPEMPRFASLLRYVGIERDSVELIVARVKDYTDSDRELQVNGAEAAHYSARGRPPPPNLSMASPLELQNVLGVDEIISAEQWRRLLPLLSMRRSFAYNFNVMHPDVLAAVLDIDRQSVQPLLDDRQEQSISRLSYLAMRTGKYLDIDEIIENPSSFLRISLWHEEDGLRTLAGIELTPSSDLAPWRIDYHYDEFAPASDTRPPQTVATPLLQQVERHSDQVR